MVEMATTIELYSLGQVNIGFVVATLKCLSSFLHKTVKVVHIGDMVLAVVITHQVFRDYWFKTIQSVWEWFLRHLLKLSSFLSLDHISGSSLHNHTGSRERIVEVILLNWHTLTLTLDLKRITSSEYHSWLGISSRVHLSLSNEIVGETRGTKSSNCLSI